MVVFTGSTVEGAIEKGLTTLGLSRSQAQITVLAKEKKGFLGLFGKQEAKVEVVALTELSADLEVDHESPVTEIPAQEEPPVSPLAQEPSSEQVEVEEALEHQQVDVSDDFDRFVAQEFVVDTPSEEEGEQAIELARQDVLAYVEKIIYEMDVEANITVKGSRRQMILQIDTPEPGRIIGYHGKVLKSLQLLAQNYLHDRHSRHFSVALNVHDYLEHRMETLIEMANRAARRVRETGRPYRLNPMTNTERKVIHKTISRISGVESYSEGDDPNRYVVVASRD